VADETARIVSSRVLNHSVLSDQGNAFLVIVFGEIMANNSLFHLLWSSLKRFEREERRRDAAALTYTTLFALVPVITVSYSILSALPALQSWGEQANQQLLTYVMPEGSSVISGYLTQFSQQARQLTWLGVPFLFATAFMLLRTIEMQFNRIWNVSNPRSGMQTFLRYWAVLSLGPLLFGAAFAASSVLASVRLFGDTALLVPGAARLIPWALGVLALTSLYMLVPNCKVPWKHALLASILVATVFEVAKFLFGRIMGMFPSYQLIYGAFAAVPLFLLWMYLGWMLLILGAEVSFALSHRQQHSGHSEPLGLRLRIISELLAAQNGNKPLDQQALERVLCEDDLEHIERFVCYAEQQQWLKVSHENELLWIRDPELLMLRDLVNDLKISQLIQPQERHQSLNDWHQGLMQSMKLSLDQPVASLLAGPTKGNVAKMPRN
jgi:membrane protein